MHRLLCGTGAALLLGLRALAYGETTPAAPAPRVFTLDSQLLVQTRQRVTAGDPALARPLQQLQRDAARARRVKPRSVMDKTQLPPSGDRHDYFSQAPYAWPDPAQPDGRPYLTRDGERNPEIKQIPDHDALGGTCADVETLALTCFLTGASADGEQAVRLLRAWFLDPATRMNPHLRFAQVVPGRDPSKRAAGIIDTVSLIRLVDAIGLLDAAGALPADVRDGLVGWFRAFNDWLLTSEQGRREAAAANNHGSWYLAQTAAYALFIGDAELARRQVEAGRGRIERQIEPDGRQPLELKRTRSFSYSLYNLDALFTLAAIGRTLGVDLFACRTADGRSLRAALDYLVPHFAQADHWTTQQITPIASSNSQLASLLRRAARAYHEPAYEASLQKGDAGKLMPERFQLLWPEG